MTDDALHYRSAGVNLAASAEVTSRIGAVAKTTLTAGAIGAFGGFGGMFRMPQGMNAPVLVSSADGVGTKIKVAIESGRHSTIGHDLVNHCTNDILAQGAVPLFFLDYIAFGKLVPEVAEEIVRGIAAGCLENQCALIGGETAEMPGLYAPPDYDLAGFIVGCVEEAEILSSKRVESTDVLVALASSGLHTNGYSLARKIVSERMGLTADESFPGMNSSVGDVLLSVHRSYLGALRPVLSHLHAIAHITGGGIPGNLDRALPADQDAVVDARSWVIPPVFDELARAGSVAREEMFRVFNMGIGMIVILPPAVADTVIQSARLAGIDAWVAGEMRHGSGNVTIA